MSYITLSKDELISKINMLEIENDSLKQELNLYKENDKIKEKYKIYYIHIEAILEAIPSAIVIVDVEGKLSYLNKRALEVFEFNYIGFERGYVYAKEKALKLDGTPYPLEEMPASYSLKYGQVVRNKHMIMQRADGKQITAIVSSSPLFDDKGKVTSAVVIIEDITEITEIKKVLNDSEEMMDTILKNSRDGINMLDLKTGKYLYMNPSQVELTGFTKEEINNISAVEAYERVHPDDREISIEQQKLTTAGIEILEDVQYRWKVKNGEYRWFGDKRKLIRDKSGQPYALVGISRDITDQKEDEEKLVLQAKILSNVNDSIIVVDENDRIIYCNKAYVKLFGWQKHELIGHSLIGFAQGYVNEMSKEKTIFALKDVQKHFVQQMKLIRKK